MLEDLLKHLSRTEMRDFVEFPATMRNKSSPEERLPSRSDGRPLGEIPRRSQSPSPALRHFNGGKGWGEGLSESFQLTVMRTFANPALWSRIRIAWLFDDDRSAVSVVTIQPT